MPTTSEDLLVFARQMAELSEDPDLIDDPALLEVLARTVANRAYYSCYHKARLWAEWRGYVCPSEKSAHYSLWSGWYGKDPATRKIRQAGESLHRTRKRADYSIDVPYTRTPRKILTEANDLTAMIDKDIARVIALGSQAQIRTLTLP